VDDYTNDIDTANACFKDKITRVGFDYHWLIKVAPDILIFDEFIFKDMRTKYSYKHIHARSRFYIGPVKLKKHQKSHWDNHSHVVYPKQTLSIMDDQMFMIPYPLQVFAFKSMSVGIPESSKEITHKHTNLKDVASLHEMNIHQMIDSPEKRQTLIWNRFNIQIKVTEFYVVSIHKITSYSFAI
jgi:hypothetical protein